MERRCGRSLWSEQACGYPFFNFVVECVHLVFFFGMSASYQACLCVCRLSCFNALTQAQHAFLRGGLNCFSFFLSCSQRRANTGLNHVVRVSNHVQNKKQAVERQARKLEQVACGLFGHSGTMCLLASARQHIVVLSCSEERHEWKTNYLAAHSHSVEGVVESADPSRSTARRDATEGSKGGQKRTGCGCKEALCHCNKKPFSHRGRAVTAKERDVVKEIEVTS